MTDFFTQLTEILEKEAARRPGMPVSEETLRGLLASRSAPGAAVPPRNGAEAPASRPVPPRQTAPAAAPVMTPPAAAPPSPQGPLPLPMADLEALRAEVCACRRCPLHATRLNPVPGEGDPHARLMFIGEGPGADEDRQGRPFVGAAGQLLDKMIAAMQFRREEVYIANVVKCRPPGNRVPMPEEAEKCLPFLREQIRLIRPEVIVLLGATAAHYLLQRQEGIMRLRGRWLEYEGIPVMPTYHPAFLLRQAQAKRDAWEDLKQVMRRFGKEPPAPRRGAR